MKMKLMADDKGLMCPNCSGVDFVQAGTMQDGSLTCKDCNQSYLIKNAVPSLINVKSENYKSKKEITDFWKHLYHAAYKDHENIDDRDIFIDRLKNLEELFQHREHLAITEMPIEDIEGKKVLEIGCGAGAHSSLFSLKGAKMTALDITLDRAHSASTKLNLLDTSGNSFSVHGDAEKLPFQENYFDIVYSNGVLHHTHDTEKAISEVFRVLRPGGRAVIMLYSKHSFLYWVNLFLLRGVLMGGIFRDKKWLGRSTEWMSEDKQEVYNPETKVYSQKRLRWMFNKFDDVKIRKVGFIFEQIPLIGKYIGRLCGMVTGYNESGILIYDKPWRNETKLELILSRYIGFANNISAIKR